MNSGVYVIAQKSTGKLYIGSSVDVAARLVWHRGMLDLGRHDNSHLQNAWNKYGPEAFVFSAQEFCSAEECVKLEQKYLDALQPFADNGFNLRRGANGGKHAPETIAKMKARVFSSKTRARLSASAKRQGYTDNLKLGTLAAVTPEAQAKRVAKVRGRKASDETRAKMRQAHANRKAKRFS